MKWMGKCLFSLFRLWKERPAAKDGINGLTFANCSNLPAVLLADANLEYKLTFQRFTVRSSRSYGIALSYGEPLKHSLIFQCFWFCGFNNFFIALKRRTIVCQHSRWSESMPQNLHRSSPKMCLYFSVLRYIASFNGLNCNFVKFWAALIQNC